MGRHLEGIDHCVVLVRDLEHAGETFERLGFTVSPLGRHGAEMGTGNHVVLLQGDYFELLGVLHPTEFNREISHLVSMREGIAAIALHTDDAPAASQSAIAAGVAATSPQSVRRAVTLPDGSEGEAGFTIAYFPEVTTPHLRLFCSQILTPEHTWVPSRMQHPNTAWCIDHIAIAAEAPESLAWEVARVVDSVPQKLAEGAVSVPTGGAPIVYLTPAALAARYPGVDLSGVAASGPCVLSLKVLDAEAAAHCLRERNIAFETTAEGLLVPPQDACGVLLVLREAPRAPAAPE